MTSPPGTQGSSTTRIRDRWCSARCRSIRARASRTSAGTICERGARFGVHSIEENFNNPYYGKLTALAYFNGGLRIWDIREPQAPREVAFYVPEADALTDPDGYMTEQRRDRQPRLHLRRRPQRRRHGHPRAQRMREADRRQGPDLSRSRQQQRRQVKERSPRPLRRGAISSIAHHVFVPAGARRNASSSFFPGDR